MKNNNSLNNKIADANQKKRKIVVQTRQLEEALDENVLKAFLGKAELASDKTLKTALTRVLRGAIISIDNDILHYKLQYLDNSGAPAGGDLIIEDSAHDELTVLDEDQRTLESVVEEINRKSATKR